MRRRVLRLLLVVALCLGVLAPPAAAQVTDPDVPEDGSVLVLHETAGFRHGSIPDGIAMIEGFGEDYGFAVDVTQDSTGSFTEENLAQYDVVIFLSTTGDVLNDDEQAAFEAYIQGGGGFAGIHAAADTEYDWAWYGDLVGAYFEGHPPGTPDATVLVTDQTHPSTEFLPEVWDRTDEWYTYDENVRGNVHVLAALDESSYDVGGLAMGEDHPIAWCQDFDGGRSWYTGGGHTSASFSEELFVEHVKAGIMTAAGWVDADCGAEVWDSFQITQLASGGSTFGEPIGMAVLPDSRVLYTTRNGEFHLVDPETGANTVIATLPVYTHDEDGLQGIALSPDFAEDGWLYAYYSPPLDTPAGDAPFNASDATFEQWKGYNSLSRFQLDIDGDVEIDLGSEQEILRVETDRGICCHVGGDIDFDSEGNLYLSTGDDTNPFESSGYAPIDDRPDRNPAFDGRRAPANTNDLRGKILRISVLDEPGDEPGLGTTYTVPEGNLFEDDDDLTRPEIFVMGLRNPFRIAVDPVTDAVLWGDYGPDAGSANPNRGPKGYVEWGMTTEPTNEGWPLCIADNKPYEDWDFATQTTSGPFDCDSPTNDSRHNTGLTELPAATPADLWYGDTPTEQPWPEFGSGGQSPMGGPIYRYDPDLQSATKFPEYYDGKAFLYEWSRDWTKVLHLDGTEGDVYDITDFLPNAALDGTTLWDNPMDMEFGPEGSLYVLNYGDGFFGENPDAGLFRIDYTQGLQEPDAEISATPTSGQAPLDVDFSAEGTTDPDGDEEALTYAWDFDGDGETDATGITAEHTYEDTGQFIATVRVTDADDLVGAASVTITVGNTAPVVEITVPPDGGFFSFGDEVAYEVTVTDPDGDVDCDAVEVSYALGHNEHAHGLSGATGCEGTIATPRDSGHPLTEELYGVLTASYTDAGGDGAPALSDSDGIILNPKLLQAEHFDEMSGIQVQPAEGAEGGARVGFTDPGDWIAFDPASLSGITAVRLRGSSGGSGGDVEFRWGAPDGPLLGTIAVENTGGWENHANFGPVDLSAAPDDSGALYVVFPDGGLDVDSFTFLGVGVAEQAAPVVTVSASPTEGEAPLEVTFGGDVFDAEGGDLTYAWDFGDGGTADTLDATHTYTEAGEYTAVLTATDDQGLSGSAEVTVDVNFAVPTCPGAGSDDFEGDSLDTERWSQIVRENADEYDVADGSLVIQTDVGDIYAGNNGAENLILQPAPSGAWEAVAEVTFDPDQNYQKAGLVLYGDDDNFAIASLVHADGDRFEFIRETDGVPRNAGAGTDQTETLPEDFPDSWFVRITSDGSEITAAYSTNGADWTSFGQPAALEGIEDPRIGMFALQSGNSAPVIPAEFESFSITGGGSASVSDEFDGDSLDLCRWDAIVRHDPDSYEVADGGLTITVPDGDIYTTPNGAPTNFILQDAPDGDWTIETHISDQSLIEWYQQGGLMVYADDDNYVKFDVIADAGSTTGVNRIELRSEVGGAIQNPTPQVTDALPDNPDGSWWLRLTKSGDSYSGEFSADGETWTSVGAAVPNAAVADGAFGVFTLGADQQETATVTFDYFRLVDEGGGEDTTPPTVTASVAGDGTASATLTLTASDDDSGVAEVHYRMAGDEDFEQYTGPVTFDEPGDYEIEYRAADDAGNVSDWESVEFTVTEPMPVPDPCPALSDTFDGDSLDTDLWSAIVREDPDGYSVEGGDLVVQATATDIYGTNNTDTPNIILQPLPDGAWQATAQLTMEAYRAYQQAGLIVYGDDDDYAKMVLQGRDTAATNPAARIFQFIREEDGVPNEVGDSNTDQLGADYPDTVWVRFTSDGSTLTASYSADGESFTSMPQTKSLEGIENPRIGLVALVGSGQPETEVAFNEFVLATDDCPDPDPEDTTPPTVDATVDGDGTEEVTLTLTADDGEDGSGVAEVHYRMAGDEDFEQYTEPVTFTEPGEYTVEYRAADNAGNASDWESVEFTVAEPGPVDECPDGESPDQTVDFGGRYGDSGVPNYDTGDGCTILDLVDTDTSNRAAFLRSVMDVAGTLYDEGIIDRYERADLIRAASRSDAGRPARGVRGR